tara:strand:+ start:657 stop:1640 length:984 start_codon:yes stop_codon:yes gene_type:complete
MNRLISFEYFGLILRGLALIHLLNLIDWKFFFHDSEFYFKLPLIPILKDTSREIHSFIFIIYFIFSMLFIFKKNNYLYSWLISICLTYFLMHDYFSFHHDIFLAINIFLLYGFMQYEYNRNRNNSLLFNYSLLSIKVLISIVYFSAGIYKINPYFHDGLLIADIFNRTWVSFLLSSNSISFISPLLSKATILIELCVPILIWTKFRNFAVIIAILMHFGISIAGKGILFNLYLPSVFILFYSFSFYTLNINNRKIIYFIKLFDPLKLFKIEYNNKEKFNLIKSKLIINNLLLLNPLFLICFVIYIYHFTKLCLAIGNNIFNLLTIIF